MDSRVHVDWYRANFLIDKKWANVSVPPGNIDVPKGKLPEAKEWWEEGEEPKQPSVLPKPTEKKWEDTGLSKILQLAKITK